MEVRFLRQSALRHEMGRYQALFEEGLIPQELYDDLKRGIAGTGAAEPRPRFEIGLDTHRLIERLEILSGLDEGQLRVAEFIGETWITHAWVKQAILLYFGRMDSEHVGPDCAQKNAAACREFSPGTTMLWRQWVCACIHSCLASR